MNISNPDLSRKFSGVVAGLRQRFGGQKVAVGLSGGVDSAVTALILREAGVDLGCYFMKNWAGEAGLSLNCPWEEDLRSAESVAEHLGLEFESVNFEKEYKERVLDYFFAEYKAGRTPNPDILCNSEIKFAAFLDYVTARGYQRVATGHYARKSDLTVGTTDEVISGEFLIPAADNNKDQTYFLSALSQVQLNSAIFPLGDFLKSEVRELASEYNLPNAGRPDSQGICFIGDLDVGQFLRKHITSEVGEVVEVDSGKVLGTHSGHYFYTIGQREGLGIGGHSSPLYVAAKDSSRNVVYVAEGKSHPALYTDRLSVSDIDWCHPGFVQKQEEFYRGLVRSVAIRYRQKPVLAKFRSNSGVVANLKLADKIWAAAPGQSAVLYAEQGICVGRGVIFDRA